MNIYERRLINSYKMLLFLRKIHPPEKIRYWQDIKTHRIGAPQRLWTLREGLKMTLPEFALSIGLSAKEYVKFEKIGAIVPERIVECVAKKYRISKKWLKGEI